MQIELRRRVVVVGSSGSGKTTFARELSGVLGAPHVELDALYWGPGWKPVPAGQFRSDFADSISGDSWVVDGNYASVRADLWKAAGSVIWLNFSFPLVFSRATSRTFRRLVSGEALYSGNREALSQVFDPDWIPWWVIRTFRRRRREYRSMFESDAFPHLNLVELKSPKEADRLLARLRAAQQVDKGRREIAG